MKSFNERRGRIDLSYTQDGSTTNGAEIILGRRNLCVRAGVGVLDVAMATRRVVVVVGVCAKVLVPED